MQDTSAFSARGQIRSGWRLCVQSDEVAFGLSGIAYRMTLRDARTVWFHLHGKSTRNRDLARKIFIWSKGATGPAVTSQRYALRSPLRPPPRRWV